MVCNADELNQVFLNIIVNAAHAIEDKLGNTPATGKGTIRITTRQPEKGLLEIRISDTGGGIPEPILEKVFDPFFTTKKQGRGTGQGLAIARTIVENRHGGRIHIETENDVGTTFVLQFPVKPARSQ
jgi:signal transduction histidine kinase